MVLGLLLVGWRRWLRFRAFLARLTGPGYRQHGAALVASRRVLDGRFESCSRTIAGHAGKGRKGTRWELRPRSAGDVAARSLSRTANTVRGRSSVRSQTVNSPRRTRRTCHVKRASHLPRSQPSSMTPWRWPRAAAAFDAAGTRPG